jgi:RNA polymerase sigma-70 factor (ECF subfamily)
MNVATNLQPDDADLLASLRRPETRRAAFSQLMKLYQERLYWQIRRLVLNHDDANDVLQNTFMKAWQSLEGFRGEAQLSTWLYTIAHNESLTLLKQRSRELEMITDDATGYLQEQVAADEYFDGDDAQRRLLLAIAALPDKQRQVFTLRYYDEMPYEEMSRVLGTSIGALKASYHFAAQKVSDYLKKTQCDAD